MTGCPKDAGPSTAQVIPPTDSGTADVCAAMLTRHSAQGRDPILVRVTDGQSAAPGFSLYFPEPFAKGLGPSLVCERRLSARQLLECSQSEHVDTTGKISQVLRVHLEVKRNTIGGQPKACSGRLVACNDAIGGGRSGLSGMIVLSDGRRAAAYSGQDGGSRLVGTFRRSRLGDIHGHLARRQRI